MDFTLARKECASSFPANSTPVYGKRRKGPLGRPSSDIPDSVHLKPLFHWPHRRAGRTPGDLQQLVGGLKQIAPRLRDKVALGFDHPQRIADQPERGLQAITPSPRQ